MNLLKFSLTIFERGAYLYIRQSSMRQVIENVESTKRQYALRSRAVSTRLARRSDYRHRQRSGRVGRIGSVARRLSAPGHRCRHGTRWHRHGARGLAPGQEQRRLASSAGDLRARRHTDPRRGWRLRSSELQRPAAARPQRSHERSRTSRPQSPVAWRDHQQGATRRVSLSSAHGLGLRRSRQCRARPRRTNPGSDCLLLRNLLARRFGKPDGEGVSERGPCFSISPPLARRPSSGR